MWIPSPPHFDLKYLSKFKKYFKCPFETMFMIRIFLFFTEKYLDDLDSRIVKKNGIKFCQQREYNMVWPQKGGPSLLEKMHLLLTIMVKLMGPIHSKTFCNMTRPIKTPLR